MKRINCFLAILCLSAVYAFGEPLANSDSPPSPDAPGLFRLSAGLLGSGVSFINADCEYFVLPCLSVKLGLGWALLSMDIHVAGRIYLGEGGLRPFAEFSLALCDAAPYFGQVNAPPTRLLYPMNLSIGFDWQSASGFYIGASMSMRLDTDPYVAGFTNWTIGDIRFQPGLYLGWRV